MIIGYGYASGSSGLIILTSDGGISWHKSILSSGNVVSAMSAITYDTLVAGQADFAVNHVLFSYDQGVTWIKDTLPTFSTGFFFHLQ